MGTLLAKWTLAEYHQMIATGLLAERQVELLRGEIVEMASEGKPHAYASDESGESLTKLLGNRAKVRQGKPITLPNQSEPEPDIAVVQRLGREYLHHHPYPENVFWVIEYSSSSLDKDLNIKTSVYAEVGIPEYWVVNLKTQTLIVFRVPQAGEYTSRSEHTTGNITPLAFPDITIPVSTIICKP